MKAVQGAWACRVPWWCIMSSLNALDMVSMKHTLISDLYNFDLFGQQTECVFYISQMSMSMLSL